MASDYSTYHTAQIWNMKQYSQGSWGKRSVLGSQNWMKLRAEGTRGKDVQDEVGKAEEKQNIQGPENQLQI